MGKGGEKTVFSPPQQSPPDKMRMDEFESRINVLGIYHINFLVGFNLQMRYVKINPI